MARLGIINGTDHLYVMPKMGSKEYYCLWWGESRNQKFTLSIGFYFLSSQTFLGPQELTAWLD